MNEIYERAFLDAQRTIEEFQEMQEKETDFDKQLRLEILIMGMDFILFHFNHARRQQTIYERLVERRRDLMGE